MLVVVLLFAAGGFLFIQARSPYFFDNLLAGGYARVDQTFDAQVDGSNLLQAPIDIAIDPKNNIYVLDYARQLVASFDPAGTYLSNWQVGGKDKQLESLAADKAGDVLVVVNGQLLKYAPSSGRLLGTSGISDIFGVGDLCRLPDGTLAGYANGTGDSLVHFDANGAEIGRVKNPISEVTSGSPPVPWQVRLAAGKDGSVYLLSTAPSKEGVYVYGPDLKYKMHFGTAGSSDGQLDNPTAIAVDSKGHIYVADWKGVQVFDPKGKYIGIIRLPFHGVPAGIAFDSQDELYLVSRTENKVYKFVLNGQ
jgi:DNA-binding beta-propeller fold protein YncE